MNDDPFELPLFDPPAKDVPEEVEPSLPLAPDSEGAHGGGERPHAGDDRVHVETLRLDPAAELEPAEPPTPATLGPRLAAGIIDLAVHAALLGVLVAGSSRLGVEVGMRHAAPLAIVVLLFSFLYHVVPLAFWGNTPGMAVAGLRTRTLDDRPLSLPQAVRRWLALLLTAATGGLGTLLALGGRSLADRLSESRTLMH